LSIQQFGKLRHRYTNRPIVVCNFEIRTSPVPLPRSVKCVCRDDCSTLQSLQQAASVQQVLQSGGVSLCTVL